MSRKYLPVVAALLSLTTVTACSGGDSEDAKPITKELTQGQITQALLGPGEMLPGWDLHDSKSVVDEGEYCADGDAAPAGWVRGGDASYEFNGSTRNMTFIHICLNDSVKNAKSAYTEWKGNEGGKEQKLTTPVGDESVLVLNPGASEDLVEGFSRSGAVTIRVRMDGTAGDLSGPEAVLAATLKRLQQAQSGEPVTATPAEELAAEK